MILGIKGFWGFGVLGFWGERLEEDKRQVAEDIKDVYAEAKGTGYDAKIIRKIVARRRADKDKLAEEQELIELYEAAIARHGQ